MKKNFLTPFETHVLVLKGTEPAFTGEFTEFKSDGMYSCKACNAALYRSADKFDSKCGWPSFDDEIPGAVLRIPDGNRTEIICANCNGHLGHVFEGEGFTDKNIRHCVNSVSLIFTPATQTTKIALMASGCFWGTEFHFAKRTGVLKTSVGYAGGHIPNPTYKQVCTGNTGHLECVQIEYNPEFISYEDLLKLFFETHDFSQTNGQGPDIGSQYLSAIFCTDENERNIASKVIASLKERSFKVATELRSSSQFYPAEPEHQKYYFKNSKTPYCHIYRKIF